MFPPTWSLFCQLPEKAVRESLFHTEVSGSVLVILVCLKKNARPLHLLISPSHGNSKWKMEETTEEKKGQIWQPWESYHPRRVVYAGQVAHQCHHIQLRGEHEHSLPVGKRKERLQSESYSIVPLPFFPVVPGHSPF